MSVLREEVSIDMDWQMTAGSDAIRITWEKPDVELLRKTCMRNPLFNTIKCIPNLVIFNSIAPRWFLLKPHHCCSTWPEIWPRNPMTSSNPPQVSLSINDADSYYWWRARQTSHGRVSRVVRISGKKHKSEHMRFDPSYSENDRRRIIWTGKVSTN